MNKKIREFENQLVNLISNAELPAEVIRLALKDVYSEVAMMANSAIEEESKETEEEHNGVSED